MNKFRGYDEENKCYRYGWHTRLAEGIRRFDAIICDIDGELTRFYIHDSKTINQYTGFKDRDGVEIYGGDKITWDEYGEINTVIWLNGSWAVSTHELSEPQYFHQLNIPECKVIKGE
mgnify:FL=1